MVVSSIDAFIFFKFQVVLKCLDDELVIDFIMAGGADEGGASVTEESSYWWKGHTKQSDISQRDRIKWAKPSRLGSLFLFSPASESEEKRLSRSTAT